MKTEVSDSSFWRTAAIYQIFPDRFAIGHGFTAKQKLLRGDYPFPEQKAVPWDELPCVTENGDFQFRHWGGDLPGITEKLDYIRSLGCNVIYLTPIFQGVTNHKYDTVDYYSIDPGFGTLEDFRRLCDEAHRRGMKVLLDGVFNHAGKQNAWLKEGRRDFFATSKDGRFIEWDNSPYLIELNLENPELLKRLFINPDSVLKYWLSEGADGWRLDCAHDLGPRILRLITEELKKDYQNAVLIGEAWNYPAPWEATGIDGLMNYIFRIIIYDFLHGCLSAQKAGGFLETLAFECSFSFLSNCWNMCSSHDVGRLSSEFESEEQVRLALLLQYTYPGIPLIYYGEERNMTGIEDPENRGAIAWDSPASDSERMSWIKTLNQLRWDKPAIREGVFSLVTASDDRVLAYKRRTSNVDEQLVIVVNPSPDPVETFVYLKDGWILGGTHFTDLISGETYKTSGESFITRLEPYGFKLLEPVIRFSSDRYTPYKRIPRDTTRL